MEKPQENKDLASGVIKHGQLNGDFDRTIIDKWGSWEIYNWSRDCNRLVDDCGLYYPSCIGDLVGLPYGNQTWLAETNPN